VSETGVHSSAIHELAQKAMGDGHLQEAYRSSTLRLYSHRLEAIGQVPGFEPLRQRARELKREVMNHLDDYLAEFGDNVERQGGNVHWARTGEEACAFVKEIVKTSGAEEVVKSKSMVGEEIELNHALEAAGIDPVETDLGELIIQLSGERPAHIVAPAIHKTRHDVSDLFVEKLHSESTEDPEQLTAIARKVLREMFAKAGVGLSGANFAVAETGSVVTIENEGNIRLCTTAPRIHIALVGIEKIIPRFADLSVFLRLLGRSATGQKLTSYTSILTGPRRPGEDGPEEMHVILIDNGRIRTLADEKMREALYCIRCGACLNTCPVYRKIGGHAYGWVYSGPIGALITPQFVGLGQSRELPFASSLCGACREVCPVKINIPDLLLHLRGQAQENFPVPSHAGEAISERKSTRFWAWAMKRPWAFSLGGAAARFGVRWLPGSGGSSARKWITKLPFYPFSNWTKERDFPAPDPVPFRKRWEDLSR
jgi:L-lactate dehydrogenase complex protein LldF